jgi:hypothetical protein
MRLITERSATLLRFYGIWTHVLQSVEVDPYNFVGSGFASKSMDPDAGSDKNSTMTETVDYYKNRPYYFKRTKYYSSSDCIFIANSAISSEKI